jgi:signal transduction histidine kinase
MTGNVKPVLFLFLFLLPLFVTAKSNSLFYGQTGYYLLAVLFFVAAVVLILFSKRKNTGFKTQIAALERQTKKIKEQIAVVGKDENRLVEKRKKELKNIINEMSLTLKALQSSLEKTKKDLLRNSVLIANLGHSIRTNLNGIIGFAILLENEFALNEEDELYEYTQNIKQSSEDLMYLLNNIIDISRIEADSLKLKQNVCDIKELTANVIEEYKTKADEKGINIVYQNEGVPLFACDKEILRHIFINLLDNAVKFTEKGYIKISTVFDPNVKIIKWIIKDTGVGIDKAYLADIFEPYRQFSLGYSKRNYQGIGLGLPLVKKLIDKMEGAIDVKSEKARGTTVTVSIPFKENVRGKGKQGKPLRDSKKKSDEKSEELKVENLNILVVEPENFDGMLMKKMLDTAGIVYLAFDGNEAIEHIENFNSKSLTFDLVFIELVANEMEGENTLLEKIRKNYGAYEKVPFIAISSFPKLNEESEVLSQGFNAYLSKPVIKTNLFKVINSLFLH